MRIGACLLSGIRVHCKRLTSRSNSTQSAYSGQVWLSSLHPPSQTGTLTGGEPLRHVCIYSIMSSCFFLGHTCFHAL